jgi:two-component system OmpR family response regulator
LTRIGRIVSKDVIIDLLFEWGEDVTSNAVEVYIHRLRKKLERGRHHSHYSWRRLLSQPID